MSNIEVPAYSHLTFITDPRTLPIIIDKTTEAITDRRWAQEAEAIVFSGYSGAMVGGAVCAATGQYPVIVRKANDEGGDHGRDHGDKIEGAGGTYSYIILDDFIASGRTMRRIYEEMKTYRPDARCVGVVLWSSNSWNSTFTFKDGHRVPVMSCDGRREVERNVRGSAGLEVWG